MSGQQKTFAAEVSSPARIHRQIDHITARSDGRRLERLGQDGVRFGQLLLERERFVPVLARALSDATFRPGQARVAKAFIAGKWRELAQLGAVDMIVHGVVGEILSERLEPKLSARVYSYRRKRSPWQALRLLVRIARAHCAARPDPKTRGLYVLRSDVASYAPSIPMDDASAIWPELRDLCDLDESSPHWVMLRALLLQELVEKDGTPVSRERGVLFGAPSSNALMNMYLAPLDEAVAPLRGAYLRFGDDVLFMHAEPEIVQRARTVLDGVLADRGLALNEQKLHVLYWNGAARPSDAWPEARPASFVPFLGASLAFDGTIRLSPSKWRDTVRELRARIAQTARLVPEGRPTSRARILARVVNESFDARSTLVLAHNHMLADLVSDRRQLAELDYLLARWIAEEASGSRGVRAFRELPYWWIRTEAGLESRVVARNRGRGRATSSR